MIHRCVVAQVGLCRLVDEAEDAQLVFRLAWLPDAGGVDPPDAAPDLAKGFVAWCLAQPGYAVARRALTSLRYIQQRGRGGLCFDESLFDRLNPGEDRMSSFGSPAR